jgi:hypothetical protein
MIPFGSKKRNQAADIIVKKMLNPMGNTDYQQTGVNLPQDQGRALDSCCEGMMRASQSGDSIAFRQNLDSYMSMYMDERDNQKNSSEGYDDGKEGYTR